MTEPELADLVEKIRQYALTDVIQALSVLHGVTTNTQRTLFTEGKKWVRRQFDNLVELTEFPVVSDAQTHVWFLAWVMFEVPDGKEDEPTPPNLHAFTL